MNLASLLVERFALLVDINLKLCDFIHDYIKSVGIGNE